MIIGIFRLLLRVVNLALLAYCIMSFVMPNSELFMKLSGMIDPLLNPIRDKLWSWFPSLRKLPVDVSPLVLWLLIDILSGILR